MVSLAISNVLVGSAFTFKILRDVDTDSNHPDDDYVEVYHAVLIIIAIIIKVCHSIKGLVIFSLSASVYNFLALAFERWMMLSWEMQRWEEAEESRFLLSHPHSHFQLSLC